MNKLTIVYDDVIFRLQLNGGISKVFSNLIALVKSNTNINVMHLKSKNFNSIRSLKFLVDILCNNKILQFLPIIKKLPQGSIFHTTYLRYSFQKNIIKVITIHDCGYEYGIMQSGLKRTIHLFFKKIAIKNCDAIICVSHNTKNDLIYFYSDIIKNKPIKVIHNGLDEIYFNSNKLKFNSSHDKYILYVGNRSSYKNFDSLVKAFQFLTKYKLILVGVGPLSPEHTELLNYYLLGRFNYLKNISETELIGLYSNAFCLVYPSSYEGFGLPIIEAMACGCPVIACKNSSIPEICNGAALLIDNPNPVFISDSILKLEDEKVRNDLIKAGKLNVSSYSWEICANKTIEFYNHLKNTL